jgi:hypothetical protein
MRIPVTLAVLGLSALFLSSCDKRPSTPSTPVMGQATGTGSMQLQAGNTSVPPAETVMAPEGETPKTAATANRSNKSMTRAEESGAMPMAGQNNDHSAPLTPPKGASSP